MGDFETTQPLRVAYLGPSASFSHQASLEAFAPNKATTFYPIPTFTELFSAIQNSSPDSSETYDYAVVPVENSTNGYVVQVLDILLQCGLNPDSSRFPDVEVVAEHYLEVHHCLYVHPSAIPPSNDHGSTETKIPISSLNITTLLTHPQAWGQCTRFLSQNFSPKYTERIDVSSTSAAATYVAKHLPTPSTSPNTAPAAPGAICSALAGQQNNLTLVASNIEDSPGQNTTRFLIIQNSKHPASLPSHLAQPLPSPTMAPRLHKSLLVFMVSHSEPGSLAEALMVFQRHGFNMTGITTRPSRERNWHYAFFVECYKPAVDGVEGSPEGLKGLKEDLDRVTERLCWLGNWVDRLGHS